MSRSLLGAGLGATGATLYLKPEVLQDWAREIMFGPSARPAGPGGKELEQLQRLVSGGRRRLPPRYLAACVGAPHSRSAMLTCRCHPPAATTGGGPVPPGGRQPEGRRDGRAHWYQRHRQVRRQLLVGCTAMQGSGQSTS